MLPQSNKIILSVNAGSSSLKISVFKSAFGRPPCLLAEATVSGLNAQSAKLSYCCGPNAALVKEALQSPSQGDLDPFQEILNVLTRNLPELGHVDEIAIICHRIVHGGGNTEHTVISTET